jgi:ABC-type antimicrobial peptide transport system permease subunit
MKDRNPVIVNETLARALYSDVDPIGRPAETFGQQLTIVGVVANVRQTSLDEAPVYQMYLDLDRGGGINSDLIVRSALAPAALGPTLRATLTDVDARLIATDIRVLDTLVGHATSPRRFLVSLLGGFSMLALILASLGIYGVVSYGVTQRTAEFGVRIALGATGREVRGQILGDTLRLTLAGVAIGIGASLALGRVIATLLYATSPTDLPTFLVVALVLTAVAVFAGFLPALRASRIEPMRALRAE